MSKQDMKIRVTEANKEAVWAALEKLGYNLEGCNRAKFLYTYNYIVDCFYGACETYFNEHNSPEYILTPQGAFAKVADYFKQPETTYAPLPRDGTEALITKQKVVADKILDKLFPIDPFAIVAGGAPRDWHFGKPATDIDVFFHTNVRQITIVEQMLKHVGIEISQSRTADNLPEWYKLNPNLLYVYETVVDGVTVQIMLMNAHTHDSVIPQFPFTICKAWYKHGRIELDREFKKCERHKIVVQTNKLYSDEHKYVQKMKGKFPEWEFFDNWEAAYKYVFEKGSV